MRDSTIKIMPSPELEVARSSSLSHPRLPCLSLNLNNLPSTPPVARMSPTSDTSTGDSGTGSSTSQIGASRPERDHATPELPSFEPLTPCTDDRCLPHSTYHSERTESAVQSLLSRIHLPLILDSILRIRDEGERFSQGLRLALSQRSVPEQHRIRSFARSLCRNCDNLCEAAPSPVNQEIDVEYRQNHEQLNDSDVGVQDDVALGSATEPLTSIQPAHIAENEDSNIAFEGSGVPGSDTQSCADHDDVRQSTFQRTDGRDPQPIHVADVDEGSGPISDAFCTATFRPKVEVGNDTGAMVSGASASVAENTLGASSPNVMPSIEPMTPERTPSPVSLRGATPPRQTDDSEQGSLNLLDQPIDDFVRDSCEQMRQFSSPGNSRETYKALLDSLGNKTNGAEEDRMQWSEGSEWVSLLEAGHGERHKGAICYALTAIAFARWHASQVRLVDGAATPQKAAQEVSARILGPKPEGAESNKKGWERRGKKLGTHLARGRKWSRLVEKLGSGILLKTAWYA